MKSPPLPLRSLEDESYALVPWQPTVFSLSVAPLGEDVCSKLGQLVQMHGNSVPEVDQYVFGDKLSCSDVDALLAHCVVTRTESAFLETELAVNWGRLTWRALWVVENHVLPSSSRNPSCSTRSSPRWSARLH